MEKERKRSQSPGKSWGDLIHEPYNIASSWRSKSKSEDTEPGASQSEDPKPGVSQSEDRETSVAQSEAEALPEAVAQTEALPEAENALSKEEQSNDKLKAPQASAKTWGEMIKPSFWRGQSKSEDAGGSVAKSEGDALQEPEPEASAENVMLKEEPSDDKLKAHAEKTSPQAPSKTWGEILHPSLKPSFWKRESKSEDAATCMAHTETEAVQEPVSQAEGEPNNDNKLKTKGDDAGKSKSQVPAKTWGEMIHPALKPSSWRRKSRDDGETSDPEMEVWEDASSKEEPTDDALKETSDDVPQAAEGTLSAVAASIRRSIAGMSRWSMGELTLGLYKLSGRHALEGAADTINGSPVSSLEELQEIAHWFHWAFAAYKKDKNKLVKELEVEESQIVKHVITSAVLKPAYFIAVDNIRHCVVMSIRGTLAATDVLTDLNPHSEEFEGGYAHSGMLAAARWLMDHELSSLRDLLTANTEYRFVLVGHSLGAGTAALLCMLLREYDDGRAGPLSKLGIPPFWITCWGYGCPPCVDRRLAEEAGFIRNIVLQDDVVARISPAALEDLRSEILQTDWSQAFKDGSKGKKMLELAQSTYAALPMPGVAKKVGHAALVAARSGAIAGTRINKAANWFTVGIAAAELLRAASSYRGASTSDSAEDDEGSEVTAATLAANVAETVKDRKQELEVQRLFIPGILYHILRKPLQPDLELSSSIPAQAEGQGHKDGEEASGATKGSTKSSKQKSKQPKFQHIVVRGDDPSSRFKRIVLSSTLLSDHGCLQYNESLTDAIRWAAHGTPAI